MNASPMEIYKKVLKEVDILVSSLGTDFENEEVNEYQSEAKQKLFEIQKNLKISIDKLEKNSEWNFFTIAFYGETNAGKSTLIETLRILLGEPTKTKLRHDFSTTLDALHNSRENLRYQKELKENVEREYIFEKTPLVERLMEEIVIKEELTNEIEETNWNIQILENNILEKRISTLWNFIRAFFNKIPEQKERKIIISKLEESKNILQNTQKKIENLTTEIQTVENLWEPQLSIIEKEIQYIRGLVDDRSKELLENEDGQIMGDGRSDYTRTVTEYRFYVENQEIVIMDLPGIEGREELVIHEINHAIEKAHVVFYISAKATPPQNGDEKIEGTIEKIKKHLSQQTEVYFTYNKRVKNPRQLKEPLINEGEQESLKEVDEILSKILPDQYKGNQVISTYPALMAIGNFWSKDSSKAQKKFLEYFIDTNKIVKTSHMEEFSAWLTSELIKYSKSKIIKANYRKVYVIVDAAKENVSLLLSKFKGFEIKLGKNAKNTVDSLEQETALLRINLDNMCNHLIIKFKNNLRKIMYSEIDGKIDKGTFESKFETETKKAVEITGKVLEKSAENILQNFESDVIELVKKSERYANEIFETFNDSWMLDTECKLSISIKPSGSIAGLVSSIVFGVAGLILGPGGWLISALSIVGVVLSVGKNVLGFFNHDYRASQQRKAVDENIEEIANQLLSNIRDNLNKSQEKLENMTIEIEESLNQPTTKIKQMNDFFMQAELELKKIAYDINQKVKD